MSTSSSREVCFLAGRGRRPRTARLPSMRSGASGSFVSIWSSGSAAACASARASAVVSFLTILVSPALVAGRSSNADDPASRLRIGPSVDNVQDDTIQLANGVPVANGVPAITVRVRVLGGDREWIVQGHDAHVQRQSMFNPIYSILSVIPDPAHLAVPANLFGRSCSERSEARRVGKECVST